MRKEQHEKSSARKETQKLQCKSNAKSSAKSSVRGVSERYNVKRTALGTTMWEEQQHVKKIMRKEQQRVECDNAKKSNARKMATQEKQRDKSNMRNNTRGIV